MTIPKTALKRCSRCGEDKPRTEFDGAYRSACRDCYRPDQVAIKLRAKVEMEGLPAVRRKLEHDAEILRIKLRELARLERL